MSERVDLVLPDSVLAEIASRAAEIVLAELRESRDAGRWLTGAKAAAEYLGCSPKRVYARLSEIPHARDGGRLVFHTSELDEWLRRSSRVPR
jgi:excisionase family DNA binding protein